MIGFFFFLQSFFFSQSKISFFNVLGNRTHNIFFTNKKKHFVCTIFLLLNTVKPYLQVKFLVR